MIDVAGWKGVDALPSNFAIGSKELQAALTKQSTGCPARRHRADPHRDAALLGRDGRRP